MAAADLESTLVCPHPVEYATRDVILLVPGTTVDPRTNFGMAWIPAFEALGYPYCYVVTTTAPPTPIGSTAPSATRPLHRSSTR